MKIYVIEFKSVSLFKPGWHPIETTIATTRAEARKLLSEEKKRFVVLQHRVAVYERVERKPSSKKSKKAEWFRGERKTVKRLAKQIADEEDALLLQYLSTSDFPPIKKTPRKKKK